MRALLLTTSISIHAPTRGATVRRKHAYAGYKISIHAPTRGATLQGKKDYQKILNFNPRSYERSDGYSKQTIL